MPDTIPSQNAVIPLILEQMSQFRKPKFELYHLVTLHWNGQERQTKVVKRLFDPDDGAEGYWFYRVNGSQNLYPESVLEPQ